MTAARRPISASSVWAWVCSGVGYHLDNFGRWLIVHAPRLGAVYAAWWTPRIAPVLCPRPGWGFAEEYYDQRQWLACRRGALWEAARDNDVVVPLTVPWLADTKVDVTLGNDNSLCLYVCGSFEPNEFHFLDGVLKPGMVFVDVGANDGYYTLFAARRVGPGGRVVSVEPSSRERGHLERNLARNGVGNVEIVPAALGRRRDTPTSISRTGFTPATTRWAASPMTTWCRRASSVCRWKRSTPWWHASACRASTSSRSTSRVGRAM